MNPYYSDDAVSAHAARRDWWRFWVASRPEPGYTRKTLSVTVVAGGRERTIGYRTKRWVD